MNLCRVLLLTVCSVHCVTQTWRRPMAVGPTDGG